MVESSNQSKAKQSRAEQRNKLPSSPYLALSDRGAWDEDWPRGPVLILFYHLSGVEEYKIWDEERRKGKGARIGSRFFGFLE